MWLSKSCASAWRFQIQVVVFGPFERVLEKCPGFVGKIWIKKNLQSKNLKIFHFFKFAIKQKFFFKKNLEICILFEKKIFGHFINTWKNENLAFIPDQILHRTVYAPLKAYGSLYSRKSILIDKMKQFLSTEKFAFVSQFKQRAAWCFFKYRGRTQNASLSSRKARKDVFSPLLSSFTLAPCWKFNFFIFLQNCV